jgi:hypothetical protein
MEETSISPANKSYLRLKFILSGIVASLIVTGVVIGVRQWLYIGINDGPTLIEAVRSGEVDVQGISGVEILKFDPGGGWPFSETEYNRKDKKSLEMDSIEELLRILKSDTTDGWKQRNHPVTYYYGILRISVNDGGHYYLFYDLSYCQGQHYVSLSANSCDSTNPNGATKYENILLAKFLKDGDPWYRDEHSAYTDKRPSSPDTKP